MDETDDLLTRLGQLRPLIDDARQRRDTGSLYRLTAERDDIRERLSALQTPTREQLEARLRGLRERVGSFDPESGILTGLSLGGGSESGHTVSAANVEIAVRAQQQQMDDAGIVAARQQIAHVEGLLRAMDSKGANPPDDARS